MKHRVSRSVLYAAAVLLFGASANAAVTRVSGPTTVYDESRKFVFFDAAYDSQDHVYLAGWGTQLAGPVNGMLFNDSGSPLSALPFALSDGSAWSGWARVIYSPETNRFLVSYVKIVGLNHHQKIARFVTISSGTPVLGPEILLDDWSGDSGSASGIVYAPASGKFIVTWSHYAGSFPLTFTATITSAGTPSCGPAVGPCTVISSTGDGETNSEIACDPVNRKCLVVGEAWGILDGTGKSAYWWRLIDDATGAPLGSPQYFFNAGGALQDAPAVVYMPAASGASAHFLVAVGYGGTILGFTVDAAAATPFSAPFAMIKDTTGTQGVGYGFVGMRYNSASRTTITSLTTWTGSGAVQELDGNGTRLAGGFDLIPEPLLNPANANSGNDFTVVAVNNNAGGFMVLENVFYEYVKRSMYTGTPACTLTPSATSISATAAATTGSIDVTGTCSWTASASPSWITITSGAAGATGPGSVGYSLAANMGAARSGAITIGTVTIPVTQAGCSYSLSAYGASFGAAGASNVPIGVSTAPACSWVPVTSAAWMAMGSGGTGSGTALFTVVRNPSSSARSATIFVGGLSYTVTQAGAVANDLSDDGKPDLLLQHDISGTTYDGRLGFWSMNGETVVNAGLIDVGEADPDWQVVGMADFDRDGAQDIVWRNRTTGANRVWLMNGAQFVSEWPLTTVSDTNYKIVGIADFNRDGFPDILWQNDVNGNVAVWYVRRATDGTFVATDTRSLYTVATNWKIRGVADFNRDGYPDIAWQDTNMSGPNAGGVAVWFMRPAADGGVVYADTRYFISNGTIARVTDPDWRIVAVADYNGDLRSDLVWQHMTQRWVAIWLTWDNIVLDTRYLSTSRLADGGWHFVAPR